MNLANILTIKNSLGTETTRKGSGYCYDDIISFDFETSSIFNIKGEWQQFNNNLLNEKYREVEKMGIAYAYAFCVNGDVYIGRTMQDLRKHLNEISRTKARTIIYVHNLAFDFQFLLNVVDDFEIFARKPHATMKAYSPSLNIEFRCSYVLTGYSLERYAELNRLPIRKKVGDLDYTKVRHFNTPLTEEEIEYIEYDVLLVYYLILNELKGGKVCKLPLTKTGKVRKNVKKLYTYAQKRKLSKNVFKSYEEFEILSKTFCGGYTHANSLYIGEELHDVDSWDLTSSYPAEMLHRKFPRSNFMRYPVSIDEVESNKDMNYLLKVEFIDLQASLCMTYLSQSKALELKREVVENGRVVQCKKGVWWITEIDLEIIKYSYNYKSIKILDSWIAYSDYLPIEYRRYIVDLYQKKTTLKDIEDMYDVYMKSKEDINSLYGMTVTNTIRDEVNFINGEWSVSPITKEEIEDKIKKASDPSNAYVSYSWGVWVTAYARKKLWDMIRIINEDVVYCDTDSIKFINNYDDQFKEFNKNIHDLNILISKDLGIDFKILTNIGEYEQEHKDYPCINFKTWGAKKYGLVSKDKGKIKLTVSGLNKNKASKSINSLDEFTLSKTWNYEESGRTEAIYRNEQPDIILTDYLGNKVIVNQPYGICIKPTTYTLGVSDEFEEYFSMVQASYNSTKLSQLGYEEENKSLLIK